MDGGVVSTAAGRAAAVRAGPAALNLPDRPDHVSAIAVFGDGLAGPIAVTHREDGRVERAFAADCFATWAAALAPSIVIDEDHVVAMPGATVPAADRRIGELTAMAGRVDAALVVLGLADCFAMTRGTAPPFAETEQAFQAIARALLAVGIRPIFVVPPPCPDFANGLFADRYIAIAATLRRMAREDLSVGLVDATTDLVRPDASGIEPDPAFATGDGEGRLLPGGAFRLGRAVAATLARYQAEGSVAARPRLPADVVAMPLNDAVLDTAYADGIETVLQARPGRGSLVFRGVYTSDWHFLRLVLPVPEAMAAILGPGDVIEASCPYLLDGDATNVAAVSLQVLPVWSNGYIGLRSWSYAGGDACLPVHAGVLQTPPFVLPERPVRMSLSISVHLLAGARRRVDAALEFGDLTLCVRPAQASRSDSHAASA